ncbi:MAG: hypothetical protein ACRD32_00545, partial [Nitrososphaerales archaeon]
GTIEIGKPVDWTQTVLLNNTEDLSNVLVELPADAQNIQIQKTDKNGTSTAIPEENLAIISPELEPTENEFDIPRPKDINLDEIAKENEVGNVVPLDYATLGNLDEIKQKDKPTVALLINETKIDANATENIIPQNETQTEYTLKFQTLAPYAIEDDYSTAVKYQKNVTIAHDSTLHYTDVRSYTNIPEYLSLHNTQFKLYWMINSSKVDVTHDQRFNVTFADTDNNGATDRMEWTVPQLSAQEFGVEADITIINVQSYPYVGGNWTVNFNTTGIADLTITGILGTTFGETEPDDLKFLELNNGTHTLYPIINLTANSITYHNYTSTYTGFEASHVMTPGDHHLMFTFGNDVAYADNFAKVEKLKIATGRFQITPGTGNQAIAGIGFQPKAYMLFLTMGNGDDTEVANLRFGIGMTNGTKSFCMSSGDQDANATASNAGRRGTTDLVLCSFDIKNSQVDQGRASHVSMDADGFTIKKRTAFSNSATPLVNYIAFGGSDLKTSVDTVALAAAVGNSVVVTSPNFQPDLVLTSFIGNLDNTTGTAANSHNSFSFGWVINPAIQAVNNQYSMLIASRDNQAASTDTYTNMSNKYAGTSLTTAGAADTAYDINSFGSQGFSVTTRTSGASATEIMGYLALDLGSSPKIYSVDTTARTAAGTISYTGSGFRPTFLLGMGSAVATSFNTPTAHGSMAIGITNGTNTNALEGWTRDALTPSDSGSRATNTQFWSANSNTGAIDYEATFSSFDNDGWTLNYGDAAGVANYRQVFLAIATTENYLIMPDAAAPGMNIAVQIIGKDFKPTDVVTTNSSNIVVGPRIVSNTAGIRVTSGGVVMQTTFFVNSTATPGAVQILINGVPTRYPFNIIDRSIKFTGTGDYTGKAGSFILGDNNGINGNRTLGGTIVLDSLIVPAGVTLNVTAQDIDPSSPGNQGYLPAIIVVDGPVQISGTGTITVAGQTGGGGDWCIVGHGGKGGPGGGGGGGGGSNEPGTAGCGGAPNNQAGNGGNGFAGGGGGGDSSAATNGRGGKGGDGTFIVGDAAPAGTAGGGDGGHASATNRIQNGTGSPEGDAGSGGGGGGGGGSGFVFGVGGKGWDNVPQPATGQGGGNGGGADSNDAGGGGGGFGTAGSNGANGDGEGTGGSTNGNIHLLPYAGGSGGGGGSADNNAAESDRHGAAGGGGGGSIVIMSIGNIGLTGTITAAGGNGGAGDVLGLGSGTATQSRGSGGGGGSGGGIVLQSSNVTITTGVLTATGGAGGDGGQNSPAGDGGAGGTGRVRVDGLRGATNIPGALTSEFVGPSITKMNGTHITGRGNATGADVVAKIWNGVSFSTFTAAVNAAGDYQIPVTYTLGTNYVTVIQNNTADTISVMSSAAAAIYYKKSLTDSSKADDDIKNIRKKISDIVKVDDKIKKNVTKRIKDSVFINDILRARTTKAISDSVRADDDIIRIRMILHDDMATIEEIVKKAPAKLVMKDSAKINDVLRARTTKPLYDSATVDDRIL